MIKYKLGGHSFSLPQSYEELTLGQFLELRKSSGDIIEVLSILSGLSVELWNQADINIDLAMAPALEWLRETPSFENIVLPSTINIKSSQFPEGKDYPVPSSLGIKSFAQKIAFVKRMELAKENSETEHDLMDYALAIYFQPEITGKQFDLKTINETISQVRGCYMLEASPVASFFLLKWQEYLSKNRKSSSMNLHQKNSELTFLSSKALKNSGLYTRFRKALINLLMKFYKWIITRYSLRSGMNQSKQNIGNGSIKL